jgi:glycosyltransferase involved in cell wall biosynthesis
MISFIIPINERKKDRLNGLFYNISKYYGGPSKDNYEIIVVEQDKNEPFKLGQNRNIGFKFSCGNIIVFLDVDIRLKNKLDFYKILEDSKNRSVICWEYIIQVKEDENCNIVEIGNKAKGKGKSGCIVFTREQYEKSCGHSNLIVGWGKEDDVLSYRTNIIRLNGNEIYHVYHKDKRELWGLKKEILGKALDRNVKIVNMVRDGIINKDEDGFNQTIFKVESYKQDSSGFIKHYNISNIIIPYNYSYIDLYNEIINYD